MRNKEERGDTVPQPPSSKGKHLIIALIVLFLAIPTSSFTERPSRELLMSVYSLFTGKRIGTRIITDESGVPTVDYGYHGKTYIGVQSNPVTVSQHALDHEEKYREGSQKHGQWLLNCADWLIANGKRRGDSIVWEYHFPLLTYHLNAPWRSGMAQGQAIHALTKAYEVSKDERYLETIKAALNSFDVEVKDGGVTHKGPEGWWYEEFAHEEGDNPRVLNGMIFTLLGLHEYLELSGDKKAKYLFDQGIAALKKGLPAYDTGEWTYYDALGNLAGSNYHRVHLRQLEELYDLTKDPFFKKYHDKWKDYTEDSPIRFCGRLLERPRKLLPIYASHVMSLFVLLEITAFGVARVRRRRRATEGAS